MTKLAIVVMLALLSSSALSSSESPTEFWLHQRSGWGYHRHHFVRYHHRRYVIEDVVDPQPQTYQPMPPPPAEPPPPVIKSYEFHEIGNKLDEIERRLKAH